MRTFVIFMLGLILLSCASQKSIMKKESKVVFTTYEQNEKLFIEKMNWYLSQLVNDTVNRTKLKSDFDKQLDDLVWEAFKNDRSVIAQKITENPSLNIDYVEQFVSIYQPTDLPYQQLQISYYSQLLNQWKLYLTSSEVPKRVKPTDAGYSNSPVGAFVNILKNFNSQRISKVKNIQIKQK